MCLVFTSRMPGESYSRQVRSLLLCLCDVFRALFNSFEGICLFVDSWEAQQSLEPRMICYLVELPCEG